jgi:hypothetical protein
MQGFYGVDNSIPEDAGMNKFFSRQGNSSLMYGEKGLGIERKGEFDHQYGTLN